MGDPLEIHGLKEAFITHSDGSALPPNSCALSSIKSNLGHLEAAAGLVGLLKVVLSFKHQELASSINFYNLNSQIDLTNSPFYIVQEHQAWPEPEGHSVKVKDPESYMPKRAGVSSFGSGGTNAHAVLEEYKNQPQVKTLPRRNLLFVLSAKNKDRLKNYAQNLFHYLDTPPLSLESFVYSLQRRQAMEERIAFFVDSFSDLKEKLRSFSQGTPVEGSYQGNIKEGQEISTFISANEDINGVFKTWLLEGKAQKVANLWVKGASIKDWDLFYEEVPPPRINLPTYPFAKDRYWFEEDKSLAPKTSLSSLHPRGVPLLHPLYGLCHSVIHWVHSE